MSVRRVVPVGLALALGFFGLSAAVHSVHHVADPAAAAHCDIASAAAHADATGARGAILEDLPTSPGRAPAPPPEMVWTDAPLLATNQGRAPPAARF
jgi:hypothetical protein